MTDIKRRIQPIASSVYCFTLFLACMLLYVRTMNLTAEGAGILYPIRDVLKPVTGVLILALSACEFFCRSKVRGLICLAAEVFCSAVYVPDGNNFILEIMMFALLSNLTAGRRISYAWLMTKAVFLGLLLSFFFLGYVIDAPMPNNKFITQIDAGHSLGMRHTNNLGALFMSGILFALANRSQMKRWKVFLLCELAALANMMLTISRSSSIIIALIPPVWLLSDLLFRKIKSTMRPAIGASLPLFVILLSFAVSFYAVENNAGGNGSINNFWLRFTDLDYVLKDGLTLWGKIHYPDYIKLDNVYLYLLLRCGLIPTIAVVLFLVWQNLEIVRQNRPELLAISILLSLYGLMEHAPVFLIVNILPLLVFSGDKEGYGCEHLKPEGK